MLCCRKHCRHLSAVYKHQLAMLEPALPHAVLNSTTATEQRISELRRWSVHVQPSRPTCTYQSLSRQGLNRLDASLKIKSKPLQTEGIITSHAERVKTYFKRQHSFNKLNTTDENFYQIQVISCIILYIHTYTYERSYQQRIGLGQRS